MRLIVCRMLLIGCLKTQGLSRAISLVKRVCIGVAPAVPRAMRRIKFRLVPLQASRILQKVPMQTRAAHR